MSRRPKPAAMISRRFFAACCFSFSSFRLIFEMFAMACSPSECLQGRPLGSEKKVEESRGFGLRPETVMKSVSLCGLARGRRRGVPFKACRGLVAPVARVAEATEVVAERGEDRHVARARHVAQEGVGA